MTNELTEHVNFFRHLGESGIYKQWINDAADLEAVLVLGYELGGIIFLRQERYLRATSDQIAWICNPFTGDIYWTEEL